MRLRGTIPLLLLLTSCFRTSPDRDPSPDPRPSGSCVLDARGGVCAAGICTFVVPPGALSEDTAVEIAQVDLPVELQVELQSNLSCEVGPASLELRAPARLSLEVPTPAPGFEAEDAVAVFIEGSAPRLAPDSQVQPGGGAVALGLEGPGQVAVSFLARRVRFLSELSAEATDIGEGPGRLQVLSTRRFRAAFADENNVYLGAGDRILVYRGALPRDPRTLPDFVLGAPDVVSPALPASERSLGANVSGIWSDGERLAVAAGHRILIWSPIPTESYAPADLVLGQSNFRDNLANRGRPSPGADTLLAPNQIWSDGVRFGVADSQNHRALLWNEFPRFLGQGADVVVGQADFDIRAIGEGALPMYQARGLLFTSEAVFFTSTFAANCVLAVNGFPGRSNPNFERCLGIRRAATRVGRRELSQPGALAAFGEEGLLVRDFVGRRITAWPDRTGAADPSFVVGKPGFDVGGGDVGGLNASSLTESEVSVGFYADRDRWIVPDGHRVLVFSPPPNSTYAPATQVFGQASFASQEPGVDYGEIDEDSLARPGGVSVGDGALAIADTANDRVLLVRGGRAIVLGQASPSEYGHNRFGAVTASTLSAPEAVLVTRNLLLVADTGNHRVLGWSPLPTENGAPADFVLGQASFDQGGPQGETTELTSEGRRRATASGLFHPAGLALMTNRLWVADTHNHRLLGFTFPFETGKAASHVLGQSDFRENAPNRGSGFLQPSSTGLAAPTGLATDGATRLFVADTENNRVLVYEAPELRPTPTSVLGQDDLESQRAPSFNPSAPGVPESPARLVVAANTMRRPRGLLFSGPSLFVADTGNHRVLEYRVFAPSGAAVRVLGQESPERAVANAFGPGGRSLAAPAALATDGRDLWVADRDNHRLLAFPLQGSEDEGEIVFGQADVFENGFNRSLGARRGLADPAGVVRAGGRLWVADRSRNRVLGYGEEGPEIVLGQPDLTRTLVNAGGEPSAATLAGPTGLATDGVRIAVADTQNHRVLVWNTLPTASFTPADVVLGQASAGEVLENRGRGLDQPSRFTLRAPQGVALSADGIAVADTGNNRVLTWTGNLSLGAPAEDVLCQEGFESNLPNRGRGGASANRCYGPTSVVHIQDRLAVADTLNDRVLIFSDGPVGRDADLVLGQADFVSRGGGQAAPETLAAPTHVTTDGVSLIVTDPGNNRVLAWLIDQLETGGAARQVVGQPSFEVDSASRVNGFNRPSAVFAERSSFIESRLWVADTGNDRIVEVVGLRR